MTVGDVEHARGDTAPAEGAPGRRGPPPTVLSWLVQHGSTSILMLIVALFSLWVRLATLEPIEAGGDAVEQWAFPRYWLGTTPLSQVGWNHHQVRFAVNFWVFLVQQVFGCRAENYHLVPVLAAVATAVFVYKLAERLGGPYAGLIAAVWFSVFQPMERSGSQILPDIFGALYVSACAYFYLLYDAADRRRFVPLGLTALCLFAGYSAKEPHLFFAPGLLLAVWLSKRKLKDLLFVASLLLGFFLLETLWFNVFTSFSTRLHVTTATHGVGNIAGDTPVQALFDRYVHVEQSWKVVLFVYFPSAVGLLGFARSNAARGLVAMGASFLLLVTFFVRSFQPLQVWLVFNSRYLIPVLPLVVATNAIFFANSIEQLARGWSPYLRGIFDRRLAIAWALGATVAIAFAFYGLGRARAVLAGSPWHQSIHLRGVLSDAYARQLPIVAPRSVVGRKSLHAVWGIFLSDEVLKRGGMMPGPETRWTELNSRWFWIPRKGEAVAAVEKKIAAGCAYVVGRSGRFIVPRPAGLLPATCGAGP